MTSPAAAQRRPRRRIRTVLTIAASDSGGGAGIQADLKTIAALGLHGATALTAVTVQDTRRVYAVEPVSVLFLRRQIDAVFADLRPAAVKIGVLHDGARIRAVARALKRWRARNVVLDPVLAASAGQRLLSDRAIPILRRVLLPLCDVVTPNLPEAEILAGLPIRTDADRREAARRLHAMGAGAVLIKGGHGRGRVVCDLLFDGRTYRELRHPRVATRATHGTGCVLSASIAAALALGRSIPRAVAEAIAQVDAGLRAGRYPGAGRGILAAPARRNSRSRG